MSSLLSLYSDHISSQRWAVAPIQWYSNIQSSYLFFKAGEVLDKMGLPVFELLQPARPQPLVDRLDLTARAEVL